VDAVRRVLLGAGTAGGVRITDVRTGASRRWRRTWLGRADWRLHRNGLALELHRTGATGRLVVHGAGAGELACPADGVTFPCRVAGLPAGELRDRLAAPLALRALLPLTDLSGTADDLAVLDEREKTVVRLTLETVEASGDPAGRGALRLDEVRGYPEHARRVTATLRAAGFDVRVVGDRLARPLAEAESALRAAGLDPGRLPGDLPRRIAPDTPADRAVAMVLSAFLDELEAAVPGTIADLDPEFLHDLRVAVRRSRAALALAGDVLPAVAVEAAARELTWLGDLTTPLRDLDVHLLDLPELATRLTAFAPADLDPLAAHLTRHRERERRLLVRGLRSPRFARFVAEWRAVLERVAAEGAEGTAVGELAADRVRRADRRFVRPGRRITDSSSPRHLHRLRKRGKELRYVLELFAPVLDRGHQRALVRELKAVQDVLGVFQDSEVQQETISGLAERMIAENGSDAPVPVGTLLAMGELVTHLRQDQDTARAAFGARFAAFVRPRVRRHVTALTPPTRITPPVRAVPLTRAAPPAGVTVSVGDAVPVRGVGDVVSTGGVVVPGDPVAPAGSGSRSRPVGARAGAGSAG